MAKKWITGLFVAVIFAGMLVPLCLPDRTFSPMENRNLAQAPVLTPKRLLSGDFAKDTESYLNEQFVGRDFLVRLNASLEYLLGLRERGGAYCAKDGSLLEKTVLTQAQWANAQANAKAVGAFAERVDAPVDLALIPSAAGVYPQRLPLGAPSEDQRARIEELYALAGGGLPVFDALLSHSDDPLYYRTDHHLTSLGCYDVYECLLPLMDAGAPVALNAYTPFMLSDSFYGTLFSKAPRFGLKPDTISAYVPEEGVSVWINNGAQTIEGSLYDMDKLTVKDQYAVFLGGNQPLIVVKNESAPDRNLLIIRDSYADSITPFLSVHFREIHLLDTRYYRQSIAAYIREHKIDRVLVMMSLSSFAQSTAPAYALGQE